MPTSVYTKDPVKISGIFVWEVTNFHQKPLIHSPRYAHVNNCHRSGWFLRWLQLPSMMPLIRTVSPFVSRSRASKSTFVTGGSGDCFLHLGERPDSMMRCGSFQVGSILPIGGVLAECHLPTTGVICFRPSGNNDGDGPSNSRGQLRHGTLRRTGGKLWHCDATEDQINLRCI